MYPDLSTDNRIIYDAYPNEEPMSALDNELKRYRWKLAQSLYGINPPQMSMINSSRPSFNSRYFPYNQGGVYEPKGLLRQRVLP